jgi:hypothetical protein
LWKGLPYLFATFSSSLFATISFIIVTIITAAAAAAVVVVASPFSRQLMKGKQAVSNVSCFGLNRMKELKRQVETGLANIHKHIHTETSPFTSMLYEYTQ